MKLKHLSLCSGIGGLDLAAEWAGFETAAQCEIDEYASKVLAKNFPGVPNLHDIRTVTNERLAGIGIAAAEITVISAGFPCQPYSLAGKGRGDRDERDLWGEVARVVGEVRPRWFVGENTPGLFARSNQRYFRRVLGDLAALGYSVGWGIWGACDVGAPHKRERVFILAYGGKRRGGTDLSGDIPYADRSGQQERRLQRIASVQSAQVHSAVSYADCDGEQQQERQREEIGQRSCDGRENVPHAAGDELGVYGSAGEVEEIGSVRGDHGKRTQGNDGGQWWEAEPDVGRVVDGISHRVDRLRCLGNAVVPQQAYPIFRAIAEFEQGERKDE